MKTFSQITIIISVIVGLCSILALLNTSQRNDILEFATTNSIISKIIPANIITATNTASTSTENNNNNKNNNNTPPPTMSAAAANTTAKLLPRLIRQTFLAVEQAEGAGARVR